jgi:hypothetical protein
MHTVIIFPALKALPFHHKFSAQLRFFLQHSFMHFLVISR